MSDLTVRLRALPLRTKVIITLVGGALVLLGVSTWLSFRYWQAQAVAIAEQQALLGAAAVRGSVETALLAGRTSQARRGIADLVAKGFISDAHVHAPNGDVLLSSDRSQEGRTQHREWLPPRETLPREGVTHYDAGSRVVHAFLPVAAPGAAYLEVSFRTEPVHLALERGLKVGLAAVVASLLAMAALLFTMLEREVVAPVRKVSEMLGETPPRGGRDEIRGLTRSVERLIEKEHAAEELAEVQRRQIEAQAGFAQVGEMAAQMAHEFKRPLASIRMAVDMMSQEYHLDSRGGGVLGAVQGQLDKLAETMQDLFSLARPVELERETVEVREILDAALVQLSGLPAMQGVRVVREYHGGPRVLADTRRMTQAALNLMVNAAEAMPEGGTLTLRTAGADGRAVFEVEDTGVGIPPERVDEVLKPFHSTKPTGTGLGLCLVGRVVAAHEGALEIDSQPGRGTTIRVALPAAPAAPPPAVPESQPRTEEAACPTHASS